MADQGNRNQRLRDNKAMLENVLRGEKVFIRAVEREDLKKRAEWINDPVVQRTLNFQYPMSHAKMQKWFDHVIGDYSRRDFSIFTIEDNKYIGFGGLTNIDNQARKAELYASIGEKEYWKSGFALDAWKVIANFGFVELGMNKIYGYQLTYNRAVRKVAEEMGGTVEGILRQDIYAHGEYRDRAVVAMLRSEWFAKYYNE